MSWLEHEELAWHCRDESDAYLEQAQRDIAALEAENELLEWGVREGFKLSRDTAGVYWYAARLGEPCAGKGTTLIGALLSAKKPTP